MVTVGIYSGTSSDSIDNISPLLEFWADTLENYELELFGSTAVPDSLLEEYRYVKMTDLSDDLPEKILRGYQYATKYIVERDPDLMIQCWKYTTHALGVALAGRQYDVPTLGRFTGDTFNEYAGFDGLEQIGVFALNNLFGRVPLRLFDGMIALGPNGKSQLVSHGMRSDDVTILPPPAPADGQFSPPESVSPHRDELGIPEEKEVFLYVGRMIDQKGMEFLRETLTLLPSLDDYLVLLVGSGPYQSTFDREFDDDHVRAVGRVPHDEIDTYYKAADCYLHPSPYEGVPLVILEALACGTPVLAREAGDIGFVTDNITRTPEEMAAAIRERNYSYDWKHRELFESPAQRERLESIIKKYAN